MPALLSQALVAFTIEFDNEFEQLMPHRTTNHASAAGARDGPWLVSWVMWSNCMQYVGEEGLTVGELEQIARTKTNLNGLERWGYVTVGPEPAGSRSPRSRWVVRATPNGRKAQEIWRPLSGVIEKRWKTRFGARQIGQLRESLGTLVNQIHADLPDCLPILGYGLFSAARDQGRGAREARTSSGLSLATLLSQVLLAFAIEFEGESDLSLAVSANVVRVIPENGVRVRDLPVLAGVSKEAVSTALAFLQKRRFAVIEQDPAGTRAKVVRLTSKGRAAQDAYHPLLGSIEERWQARSGQGTVRSLREHLERLSGGLFRGLKPYPDGWRASLPAPVTLPHYPMVLHRGGFPDGS